MNLNNKIKKRIPAARAGFTLMELLIALAVLAVTITPIMGLFVMAAQNEAKARQLTIATVTAQMRMEELVGMTTTDFDNTWTSVGVDEIEKNGIFNDYEVTATVEFNYYKDKDNKPYPNLAHATVVVFDKDGTTVLYTLEDILRVGRAE